MNSKTLSTARGELPLPAFLPDATRGVVRTLDAADLKSCGIAGLMVNTLHLIGSPGAERISSLGGIHAFMGWNGPVASDSGGFQVYSLVSGSARAGSVSSRGFTYRQGRKKRTLTPETCIRKQFMIGADLMFCLDHCTHPDAPESVQYESVEHTVEWARRCRAEYGRLLESGSGAGRRTLLYAVVQGGSDLNLRKRCAEALLDIGFDGFGFGGWPIAPDGGLVDAVAYVAELLPGDCPRHALGIGKPENLVAAFQLGYATFDCAIPTRDARRGRLYRLTADLPAADLKGDFYRYLYIGDERYARDSAPVDEHCDCPCCARYSRAYLHHLFQADEGLGHRLATLHNLRFYARLLDRLRGPS